MARAFVEKHIASVPMFTACTRKELQTVSKLVTEIDVPSGKKLTEEGQPGHEFIIVLEGSAVATRGGKDVATFGPGDYFGEIALLDPGLRTATVTATSDMQIAVVDPGAFSQMLEEVPPLAAKIMRGLAKRLREVDTAEI